jgi:type I restriction enzyme, R subunit
VISYTEADLGAEDRSVEATMTPEQKARQKIDQRLVQCGWLVQNHREMNISAGPGVAIREFPLKKGFADYLLYVCGKALGTIEAKPEGKSTASLTSVAGRFRIIAR